MNDCALDKSGGGDKLSPTIYKQKLPQNSQKFRVFCKIYVKLLVRYFL